MSNSVKFCCLFALFQTVSLRAHLALPTLHLSSATVDFGTCYVGQTTIKEVYLYNRGGSCSYWTALTGKMIWHWSGMTMFSSCISIDKLAVITDCTFKPVFYHVIVTIMVISLYLVELMFCFVSRC